MDPEIQRSFFSLSSLSRHKITLFAWSYILPALVAQLQRCPCCYSRKKLHFKFTLHFHILRSQTLISRRSKCLHSCVTADAFCIWTWALCNRYIPRGKKKRSKTQICEYLWRHRSTKIVYLKTDKLCKRDCGVHLCQQVTALLFFLPRLVLYVLDQKLHPKSSLFPCYSQTQTSEEDTAACNQFVRDTKLKDPSICTFSFGFLGMEHAHQTACGHSVFGAPICHKHVAKTSTFLLSDLNYILQALTNYLLILRRDKECFKEWCDWLGNLCI